MKLQPMKWASGFKLLRLQGWLAIRSLESSGYVAAYPTSSTSGTLALLLAPNPNPGARGGGGGSGGGTRRSGVLPAG